MAKQFYHQVMGEISGPMSGVELRDKALGGDVTPDTLVRINEDGKWVSAARLTSLFDDRGRPLPHPDIVGSRTERETATTENAADGPTTTERPPTLPRKESTRDEWTSFRSQVLGLLCLIVAPIWGSVAFSAGIAVANINQYDNPGGLGFCLLLTIFTTVAAIVFLVAGFVLLAISCPVSPTAQELQEDAHFDALYPRPGNRSLRHSDARRCATGVG